MASVPSGRGLGESYPETTTVARTCTDARPIAAERRNGDGRAGQSGSERHADRAACRPGWSFHGSSWTPRFALALVGGTDPRRYWCGWIDGGGDASPALPAAGVPAVGSGLQRRRRLHGRENNKTAKWRAQNTVDYSRCHDDRSEMQTYRSLHAMRIASH